MCRALLHRRVRIQKLPRTGGFVEGQVRTGLSGHRSLDRGLYGLHLAAAL